VGYDGLGTLLIKNGGQVSSKYGGVGYHSLASTECSAKIDGANSKWISTDSIWLGKGSMELTHGGQFSGNTCSLDAFSIRVTGLGSIFSAANLTSGWNSNVTNSISISDGGQATIPGLLKILNSNCSINIDQGTLNLGAITGNFGSFSIRDSSGVPALIIGSSTNSTFAGSIADNLGTGSLKKIGSSKLTLSGPCSYTGSTLITAGTLALGSSGTLGSSLITVESGANFDVSALTGGYILGPSQKINGSGTIVGDLTINGIHAPGNSPGIETVQGNYNLLGELQIELLGTTVGTGYDQVLLSGGASSHNATLGGTLSLDWTGMAGSSDSTKLWILKNDTAGTLSGTFSNYANGAMVGNYDGRDWFIWYGANAATGNLTGGNDVVLAAVPEPAAMTLLGLAAGGIFFACRGRRGVLA
jgi:fibronectin-binding autotransporter adhesin